MAESKNINTGKSCPIIIPSSLNIKRTGSHNDKLNFLYNSEELYYSSDLIFPPDNNNPPNDNNKKRNYVQILDTKSKISPGSYEKFDIYKYF